MFKRLLGSAYTCPKCQCYVSRPGREYISNGIRRRPQSSAAHASQEDIDDTYEDTEESPVPRRPELRQRYRHWRPPPTAQLGVNALGQPAEVLVLPQANRVNRDLSNDTHHHEGSGNENEGDMRSAQNEPPILETISGELQPPSEEDIAKHIDQIRDKFGRLERGIDHTEWLKLREELAKSFSTRQLSAYVDGKMKSGKRTGNPKRLTRTTLADQIIGNVWEYKDESRPTSTTVKRVHNSQNTRLLLANHKRLKIARVIETNVHLAQLVKRQSLQLSGPASAVEKTIKSLQKCESRVVELLLPVTPDLQAKLSTLRTSQTGPYSLSPDLLALRDVFLRTRVTVRSVKRNGDFWRVEGLDDIRVKAFLKQLSLWMNNFESRISTSPLLPCEIDDLCTLPVSTNTYRQSTSPWLRHILRRPAERKKIDGSSVWSQNVMEDLRATILQAPPVLPEELSFTAIGKFTETVNSVYRAEIGLATFQAGVPKLSQVVDITQNGQLKHEQALLELLLGQESAKFSKVHNDQYQKEDLSLAGSGPTASSLITRIPLLAQFLSQQQLFEPSSEDSSNDDLTERDSETLIRLLYRSIDAYYPSLEIYASIGRSTINVKCVTCVLGSAQQCIAFPHLTADLKLTKTNEAYLYQDGTPLDEMLRPFMATVAHVLRSVTKNDAGQVIGLDMLAKFDMSTPPKAAAQGLVSVEDSPTTNTSREASYLLSTAEQVQSVTYKTPFKSHFLLEHLHFTPLRDSPDHSPRDTLRVVHHPLLRQSTSSANLSETVTKTVDGQAQAQSHSPTIGSNPDKFDALLKAAYGTVNALDRFINKSSRAMVERNKQSKEEPVAELD